MKADEPGRRQFRFGLASKLILLVMTATLIVGIAVGAMVLIKSRDALRERIIAGNLNAADIAAQFAAQYVSQARANALELATRPLIVRAAANRSFAEVRPELVRFLRLNPRFDAVSIFDTEGIARVSGVANPLHIGKSSADRDWFQQAKTTGKPYLGVPVLSRATGRPNAPYGVPIFDGQGNLQGVLVAGISLAALSDAIATTQVHTQAHTALIDFRQGGIILAHIDQRRIMTALAERNETVRRLLGAERGALETIDSAGERVLKVFEPVPGSPWGILITEPHQSAFAALDALTRKVLLLGSLAILLMALTGGWLAQRVTRPLLALRDAARALAAGDLTCRVKISRRDEIGELAQVFDGMAEALQAEQTTLRRRAENFFHLSPDLLCLVGFDGYFKMLNPAWERTLGFTVDELQARPFLDLVHPDDRQATIEATARLNAGQDLVAFENRYLCKDGSCRWLRWNAVSSVDEQLIYAVAHDVTERRRAEEALCESEKKYRLIADNAHDWIYLRAPDGAVLYTSPSSERVTGYSPDDFTGNPRLLQEILHPDYRDIGDCHFEGILGEKEFHNMEFGIITKAGETRWISHSCAPVYTAEGEYIGRQGTNRDITLRKQAVDRVSLARQVLSLLNNPESETDAIHAILLLVKESQGLEAVGIRLGAGDDFPYFHTAGFPDHFVEAERYLCVYDGEGNILRDGQGNPVLSCMCGNIICRRTDAALPFFTGNGSFWTNSTTDLLASTTEEDRQGHTRNRCNAEGYESVAMIPLRSGDEIIGLLQLNDRRRNRFTLEMIHFFEGLGSSIGIALSRQQQTTQLIRSSREKALFLKEIHHRVKNNLQIITSLLRLSAKYSGDGRVEEIFRESQDRIRAMAAVHSMLYKSENLAEINFGEYVREMARQLFRSYNANPEAISLLINAEDVKLPLDTAIPCGLIINELVTNALKHALPE
ncbi:MAG: PAS domain S-box protein, partial [Smithellaceae bacterium]|nr:PAS domain S-box protein [Smithellaceae bacterium]